MASKPTKPSGLSITRNNNTFSFGWKLGAKYTAQNLCYRVNNGTKIKVSIGKATTAKSVTIDLAKYYPKTGTKLIKVVFSVQGKKSKWSDWANKEYAFHVPATPKLSVEWSSEYEKRSTFSWNMDWTNTTREATTWAFRSFQWWTTILQNSDKTPQQLSSADWNTGTTGVTSDNVDTGSKTIDESSVFEDNYSYTRYFKVISRGPGGDSPIAYASHVYAFPNAPRDVKAKAIAITGGYRVSVSWIADTSNSRPIDSVSIEYCIDTPVSSATSVSGVMTTTLTPPQNLSWTSATTIKDTSSTDSVAFVIDGGIPVDKCIFVRVVTKHDNKTSPSETVFVENGYGLVTSPSSLSATINEDNLALISLSNGSSISASFVGIYHRTSDNQEPRLVGIWPANQSGAITVQLPDPGEETFSIGMQTFVGDYTPVNPALAGVTEYAIPVERMKSSGIIWDTRPVPKPPTNITLSSPRTGVIRVTWDWTWTSANGVELSWANHDDAWESTDEPSNYILENTRASAWNIAGLDVGTWYVRVRLFAKSGDSTTYGTYSDIKSLKITATPATPVLTISPTIITPDGKITCYWAYSATDGNEQAQAEIREVTLNSSGTPTTYTDIGVKANNEQYKTISIPELGWEAGSIHYLAVKVMSGSGEQSDNWSVPKPIQILNPITSTITSTSLVSTAVVIDDTTVPPTTETKTSLTVMPLLVSATGAGSSGKMTYILERAADYHLDRPDESEITGFEGETVALIQKSPDVVYTSSEDTEVDSAKAYYTRSGSGTEADPYVYTLVTSPTGDPSALNYYEISSYSYDVSIDMSDLIGPLDDGAAYNLVAIAQDSYGQTASATIPFEVHWTHQAVAPTATISVDNDLMVAFITPIIPGTGYITGDVCDIYRLSTDKPELIVKDAAFGTKYVDPYPALGNMGGHRIVYRTINGDYITEDNEFAWTDYNEENSDDVIDRFATVVDFGEDQVVLPYDLSLSSRWTKDFTTTKYLGGSMAGDWNPAVERSGSIKTRVAVQHDPDLVSSLRRLANYAGICHVRTPDGSSFAANVNVSEDREEKKINMLASFSLEITRVDPEGFDGLTYAEWINDEQP